MNSSRAVWWEHTPRTTGLSEINPTAFLGYVGGDKSDKAGSNPAIRARTSGGGRTAMLEEGDYATLQKSKERSH